MSKQASETQVAWALLSEATTAARLEVHRLRHLVARGMQIVDASDERDHIYQVAGDLLMTVPQRMDTLERHLDRLSYALSVLGADHLRDRLPMSDRALVDEATHKARPFTPAEIPRSAARVSHRFLAEGEARKGKS